MSQPGNSSYAPYTPRIRSSAADRPPPQHPSRSIATAQPVASLHTSSSEGTDSVPNRKSTPRGTATGNAPAAQKQIPPAPQQPQPPASEAGPSSSRSRAGVVPDAAPARGNFSFRATLGGLARSAASAVSQTAAVASSAASALTSEEGKTWEEWYKDYKDGRRANIKGQEELHLLPGWVVKKRRRGDAKAYEEFDLHVHTSGFCIFVREVQSASRTQRALISLAKRFAALPKMPMEPPSLEGHLHRRGSDPELLRGKDDTSLPPPPPRPRSPSIISHSSHRTLSTDVAFADPTVLTQAHENLDLRLRPFYSTGLGYRRIAISIYSLDLSTPASSVINEDEEPLLSTMFTANNQGLFAHNLVIPWERICTHAPSLPMIFAEKAKDRKPWGLGIKAELLVEQVPTQPGLQNSKSSSTLSSVSADTRSSREPSPRADITVTGEPETMLKPDKQDPKAVYEEPGFLAEGAVVNRSRSSTLSKTGIERELVARVSEQTGVRVISDLDDTIKHSDILAGSREVFRNVFCRPLEDICVPGMNELYSEMATKGISGFHFISNSPFELLTSIIDFFHIHRFPTAFSLKLKFYGTRSIVSSLFEGAADRKRASVMETLDAFKDSRFICFGDSGEQDLELYTEIARARPNQVVAVFIRDVTSGRAEELKRVPLARMPSFAGTETPPEPATPKPNLPPKPAALTSISSGSTGSTGSAAPSRPVLSREPSIGSVHDLFASQSSSPSGASTPTSTNAPKASNLEDLSSALEDFQALTSAQQKVLKRAALWEQRVEKAKADMPPNTKLWFFKDSGEIESHVLGLVEGLVAEGEKEKHGEVSEEHKSGLEEKLADI